LLSDSALFVTLAAHLAVTGKTAICFPTEIGPASYVVNAGDLRQITAGNHLFKYADDTYLITPLANADTCAAELQSIEDWAKSNSLKLNHSKSVEIIIMCRSLVLM